MKKVRRVVAVVGASALMLSVAAFPALAIGDGPTPAGECANSDSAVGTPEATGGINPGFDNTGGLISAPVSKNNPGEADTIAQGDTSAGINADNCLLQPTV